MKQNKNIRNYNDDLKINEDDLEGEWLEQPSRYMYYCEALADAIYERDKAKTECELVECELDNYLIRNYQKIFGEKFPSEQMRRNKIVTHEKYRKAIENLDKCNRDVNYLQAAKYAFDHRKKALENLVTLLVTGFHSDPKVRKEITRRKHLGLKKGFRLKKMD